MLCPGWAKRIQMGRYSGEQFQRGQKKMVEGREQGFVKEGRTVTSQLKECVKDT